MRKWILHIAIITTLLTNSVYAKTSETPSTYKVAFGSFASEYPVVAPKGNQKVKIVYIPDFSDNYRMGEAAAISLAEQLPEDMLKQIEAVVIPGDKANMIGTLLYQNIASKRSGSDYGITDFVILRSSEKGRIENTIRYDSITGGSKALNIRQDQSSRIKGKKVLLFDDVLSSGGTLKAAKELTEKYGCQVVAVTCVATEGDKRDSFEGKPLFYLTHLPVWVG